MRGTDFDEVAFFRAIQDSGARALLIGRRTLVLLGLPVLTADYDFWIAIEDIEAFNGAAVIADLQPMLTPEDARRRGRYVLENDEHVDVLVARSAPTVDGQTMAFADLGGVGVRRGTTPARERQPARRGPRTKSIDPTSSS